MPQLDVRVHGTLMTWIEPIDADLLGFIRLPGALRDFGHGYHCF
jgi:hypothetical protein